ncbi:MAG: SLBB domain-containing protein [Pseudomonadota bacterium]
MLKRSTLTVFAALFFVTLSHDAPSQSIPEVSPEQLQMLRSLPASQRQQLMEQFGLTSESFSEAQRLEFPELLTEREQPTSDAADGEPRVQGGETLVVTFDVKDDDSLPSDIDLDATFDARPVLAALVGTNTFTLSDDGLLTLSGVADVPLAGLTAEEITTRLRAVRDLQYFDTTVKLLPLAPIGVDALEYFGYDLFEGVPTTFAPATDIPVPANYVLGPGDELQIDYFGKDNRTQTVIVSRDGSIMLGELGPLSVAGLTFQRAREEIVARVGEQKIGVRASVTMGELRSIRIFVLGDVTRPGSYVVSGLSSMTNALFLSGGVKTSGSLRRVQLKRDGKIVGALDLYDLLLRGDTRNDRRLLPGDVIFVPPVGDRVGIEGEVERPAYYELKTPTTSEELVRVAGGLKPTALASSGRIERIAPRGDRKIIDADLTTSTGQQVRLQDGDVMRILPVLDRFDDSVALVGHVRRPVQYQWREGLRLTDVVPSLAILSARADTGYLLIRREISEDGRIEVRSADLNAALREPSGPFNVPLLKRDSIRVFPLDEGRGAAIRDILKDLEAQATPDSGIRRVEIGGSVRAPGQYPLEPNMRISDLIRAGGGLADSAFLGDAELSRYVIGENGSRVTELMRIDLQAALDGDAFSDQLLQPYDYLTIREVPEWREQEAVTLEGEVRFPGVYPIQRGETLSSVVARAGGVTNLAFLDGSVFTRLSLKQREEEQLDVLIGRLEADLATYSLQAVAADASAQQAFALGQGLLSQLKETRATGRLVIDLRRIMANADTSDDIQMRDGDRLFIPQITQEVTVIGEVQYATSHVFDNTLDRGDYIARSGGITPKADERNIYVVRANGEVIAGSNSRWLRRVGGTDIRPGDTIVVPLDADRLAPLTLWSSVTQIVYNLAIAIAAVNSF